MIHLGRAAPIQAFDQHAWSMRYDHQDAVKHGTEGRIWIADLGLYWRLTCRAI